MLLRLLVAGFIVLITACGALGGTEKPLLLHQPTVSATQIAFTYAGDLWIVGREGGDARRLTSHPGRETDPIFSPDGKLIAFTGEYDGNVDVYVMPADGGVPRRLTYHPAWGVAVGWTPDGNEVLFASSRNSFSPRFNRLFTMPLQGVFPRDLPLPIAEEGSFSTDGSHVAYVPTWPRQLVGRGQGWLSGWKRYRGGGTARIWLARLSDSHIEKIPRQDSNDFNPMWIDHRIYFLSDRNGPVTLFAYDTVTKQVTQVLENDGPDINAASAGPGAIVYEQLGAIHLFDLKSGKAHRVDIRVKGDLSEVRPRFKKVTNLIRRAALSPTGVRAIFEARGELLTVPADKGDIRNLTNTPGVAERNPAWSPNGQWIAYFSDESGEYALHVRNQSGTGQVRKIPLRDTPALEFDSPVWSPDGQRIAYNDLRQNLWYVDLNPDDKKGHPVAIRVDHDANFIPRNPAWSPDSRWLAYTKLLNNHYRAVFVHELATAKNHQLTDGMSYVQYPAFDRNGDYLYFIASTDIGPALAGFEMSSFQRPVTRSAYVVLLRQDLPSPLAPQSDEEKPRSSQSGASPSPQEQSRTATESRAADTGRPFVRIDFDNIAARTLRLPIPARNYSGLVAGKTGTLFLVESELVSGSGFNGDMVHRFDLATRKMEKLVEGISTWVFSSDGAKMLFRQGERWATTSTAQAPKPDEGTLKLDTMEVLVDPRAEWRQMFDEGYRIVRDFFYDPSYHGLDLKDAKKRYEPYLQNLASRGDLTYLFAEMYGELTVSHFELPGGDQPEVKRVPVGLLGADYRLENGRYRFARVFEGDPWHAEPYGPLTQPGVNIKNGEYLLAINGRKLTALDNIYRFFEGKAGKSVVLRVGPKPNGTGAREVTVVPVDREAGLRQFAWMKENQRKVHEMSGGRVAYLYLPNTHMDGYANFNQYYFAQSDREGLVIDERFNNGGATPDYIINSLRRPLMNYWAVRLGEDWSIPVAAIQGPKALIVNERAASGGDNLPWMFRRAGLGPLVGKTTAGAEVGNFGGQPLLIDGGYFPAPSLAFYTPEGEWQVENRGVVPDIDVEWDPQSWRAGRDPQLEKAVEWVLKELKKHPLPQPKRPPSPNYISRSRKIR